MDIVHYKSKLGENRRSYRYKKFCLENKLTKLISEITYKFIQRVPNSGFCFCKASHKDKNS